MDGRTIENSEQLRDVLERLRKGSQVTETIDASGQSSFAIMPGEEPIDLEVGLAVTTHPRCWVAGWGNNGPLKVKHWRWKMERRLS